MPPSRSNPASIASMFGAIADRYDLMNRVMTLGQDQRWRRQAAELTELKSGDQALDVATGTGDLALQLGRRVAPNGHVIGIDFSQPMLALANRKASRYPLPISFELGDAGELTFADESFDAVTCAFGLRNFADRARSLAEMVRVARIGGRVVILEVTPPRNALARTYMETVVPRLGQVLAHARQAYTYLPESAVEFPDALTVGKMMQSAGLRQVRYRILNLGTIALHWGIKSKQAGG